MDPHSPALVDAMLSAEMFGVSPPDLLLIGIKAKTFDVGCSLSEPVKASIEEAIGEVLNELDRLSVGYRHRTTPIDVDIWWETDRSHFAPATTFSPAK
jgi:hypothetical protein